MLEGGKREQPVSRQDAKTPRGRQGGGESRSEVGGPRSGEEETGGRGPGARGNSRATDFADGKQPENESGNQERGEQPNYPQRGSGNEPKPFRCQNLCR